MPCEGCPTFIIAATYDAGSWCKTWASVEYEGHETRPRMRSICNRLPQKARRPGISETHFLHMPHCPAWLYDWFMRMKPTATQTQDVAQDMVSRIGCGRLLDIGTGHGRLLFEIHRLNPTLELFGLDISPAMIAVAKKNLKDISSDLRQGRSEHTDYPDDVFDLVTCTGSLYLWDYPEEGLEEIFRILKPGRSAYLFEVYKDVDPDAFQSALRAHLRELDPIRRLLGPYALRKALRIAYRMDEYVAMIKSTSFVYSFTIEKIQLASVPMWLRIVLTKTLG